MCERIFECPIGVAGVEGAQKDAKNDQRGLKPPRPCPALDDREMCVCSALRSYLARATHPSPDSVLFYNTLPNAGRAALAPTTPTSILRGRLSEAKVPALELQTYASNSLRKGGVSSAFAHGVPLEAIKRHGGWSSNAVNAYITDPVAQRLAIGRAIYFEPDSEEED